MPIGSKTPAYWILPSQVIRSSQYGCNCRGMGSDPVYKGGCGELDVAAMVAFMERMAGMDKYPWPVANP
jgi:hypothetical protein